MAVKIGKECAELGPAGLILDSTGLGDLKPVTIRDSTFTDVKACAVSRTGGACRTVAVYIHASTDPYAYGTTRLKTFT